MIHARVMKRATMASCAMVLMYRKITQGLVRKSRDFRYLICLSH